MTRSVDDSEKSLALRAVDDPKERRKIQNRLNQRASRARRTLPPPASRACEPRLHKWTVYVGPPTQAAAVTAYFCSQSVDSRRRAVDSLRDRVTRAAITRFPSPDLLLPVTQWNLIRAAGINACLLGLSMTLLAGDIISPFNNTGPWVNGELLPLPPSLQPTALQRSIIHHPWLDIIAVPSIRDALLRYAGAYSEDELYNDLYSGLGPADSSHVMDLDLEGVS
ncbi:hypothetical protein BJX64DRAFT_291663 [Aspergillus heterothallicus]